MEMEDKYVECHKTHKHLDGKIDGCQAFWGGWQGLECMVCGCLQNFHRKVEAPVVVYTICHKIHTFGSQASVDGCQEFEPSSNDSTKCAHCICDKAFHRNLLTA